MNSTTTISLLLLAAFTVAGRATAQPITEAERQLGQSLARTLGTSQGAEVVRITPRPDITGVRVILGEGLFVERITFADAAKAQQYVAHIVNGANLPVPLAGELRGKQAVLVRGERARDGAFARRALTAGWGGAPAGESDTTFANLMGDIALSTRLPSGPARKEIDEGLAKAQEAAARPGTRGIEVKGADWARVAFESGFTAVLKRDAAGVSVYSAMKPEREAAMKRYFTALGGHPATVTAGRPGGAARATAGAAGALGELFGD